MSTRTGVLFFLVAAGLWLVSSSYAQVTWRNDSADGQWFTATNWSGNRLPLGSDDVALNANCTPDAPVVLNSTTSAYTGTLKLGNAATEAGYLTIHTSLTCSNDLYVGDMGTGVVQQAGGRVAVGDDMLVGEGSGGVGSYTLTHTAAVLEVGHFLYIARDAGAQGELILEGGRVQVADDLICPDGGEATVSLLGGAVHVGRHLKIGNKEGAANGCFVQQGGQVVVSNSLYLGGAGATSPSTNHLYRLAGGSLSVTGSLFVGYAGGQGRFEHSGGSLTVGGDLYVARSGTLLHRFVSEFSMSGEAVLNVAGYFYIGRDDVAPNQVTGVVRVATSHLGSLACQGWTQRGAGRGVLAVTVDSASCVPVHVRGPIRFDAGSVLDVSAAAGAVPGVFTVLECEGTLTDDGLQFAAGVDTRAWSFSTAGKQLVITYAPPPPAGSVFCVH